MIRGASSQAVLGTGTVLHWSSMVPTLMSLLMSLLPNGRLWLVVWSEYWAPIGWWPDTVQNWAFVQGLSWQWWWWCVSVRCHLGETQHWTEIERQSDDKIDMTKPDWEHSYRFVVNYDYQINLCKKSDSSCKLWHWFLVTGWFNKNKRYKTFCF